MVEALVVLMLVSMFGFPLVYLAKIVWRRDEEVKKIMDNFVAEHDKLIESIDERLSQVQKHNSWEQALSNADLAEESLLQRVREEYFGG